MNFHKTENIKTEDQLNSLISHHINFIESGEGKPTQFLNEFSHAVGESITWINQTEKEIEQEEKQEQDDIDLVESYKTDVEKWRNDVIKPWSMQKLSEWIDSTFLQPLKYNLSEPQVSERETKRDEILKYHNQLIYKTDNELEVLKPKAPSYIK